MVITWHSKMRFSPSCILDIEINFKCLKDISVALLTFLYKVLQFFLVCFLKQVNVYNLTDIKNHKTSLFVRYRSIIEN